jgi:vacuolar-type H+-ATPase subunit I/STV1
VKNQTPAEIEARIDEIEAEENRLADIDHEALMTQAVLDGADLDAIEQQQVDDERRLKRLRAERSALMKILPDAKKRAAQPELERLKAEHAEVIEAASKHAANLREMLERLPGEIDAFGELIAKAQDLTSRAVQTAQQSGATCPPMGAPRSLVIRQILSKPAFGNQIDRLHRISNLYDSQGHSGEVVDAQKEQAA